MKDKPVPRQESIVSKKMLIEVIISALFITAACLSIRFVPVIRSWFGIDGLTPEKIRIYLNAAVFATFMMAITFNGFNARTEHTNVFEHLGRNKNFLTVMGSLLIIQFLFVTFGGEVLSVTTLNATTWIICILIAFLIVPIDIIRKTLMK